MRSKITSPHGSATSELPSPGMHLPNSLLGIFYFFGRGGMQSFSEAAKWYRLAAEQGLAQAQRELGWLYDTGRGVSKSLNEAMSWYRKAAEQGDAGAK